MPIRKFRTMEGAGRRVKFQPGTAEFSRILRSVFRLAALFAPSQEFPSGLYRFRSVEQAQAQKMAWIRAALSK